MYWYRFRYVINHLLVYKSLEENTNKKDEFLNFNVITIALISIVYVYIKENNCRAIKSAKIKLYNSFDKCTVYHQKLPNTLLNYMSDRVYKLYA